MAKRGLETVDGVEVTITRAAGRPLLLLTRMASAGFGIWDAIWDDLARRFTVASFDLVGVAGLEQDLAPRERFRRLAEVSATVAEGLGFARYHLFGWYGGCHVALASLIHRPERLISCVMLDPFFELDDMRKIERGVAFKRVLFAHENRELYAYYWVMAGFSPAFMEANFDVVERLARARVEKDRFLKVDAERWTAWVRALRRNWASEAELAAITTPTLILATELDGWHAGPTVGMARALRRRIASAELVELRGVGTFFFIEDPARFAEAADAFLQRAAALP